MDIHTPGITYRHLTDRRTFGLDNNHAVRPLGTVKRLCRRVFQRRDRLHPVHIHVHHLLDSLFKTVHDKKRLVRVRLVFILHVRETGSTAHLDFRHPVRVGTELIALYHLKRRIKVFQGLQDIHITHFRQIFRFHGTRRTRVTLSLPGKDTGNHDFFHLLHVLFQRHVYRFLPVVHDLFRQHPHVREYKYHILGQGKSQRIATVNIGSPT